jgi:DNA-binding GntR family transcriptional regulator
MRLDIDGFAILRTIGGHRESFAAIAADVVKAARALLVKQMTHKRTGLKTVRDIRAALGAEAFSLIIDGMTDAQIRALTARLDRHAAAAKAADGTARLHVVALAEGSAQPAQQPDGGTKKARTRKPPVPPKTPPRVHYASAGATRTKG